LGLNDEIGSTIEKKGSKSNFVNGWRCGFMWWSAEEKKRKYKKREINIFSLHSTNTREIADESSTFFLASAVKSDL
jgi:aspartate/methionine/tyrosine aminotransferase